MSAFWRQAPRSAAYLAAWSGLAWALWRAIAVLSPSQYPALDAMSFVLLLAGCGSVGALSRLLNRRSWEACAAVFVTALLAMTHIFRYYVLDYSNGPPSFLVSFRDTGLMNAPFAAFLSVWPLLGWYATGVVLRRLGRRST